MSVLVDTSVWSLAFRRDGQSHSAHVGELRRLIEDEGDLVVTGLVLQELLQGFGGARDANQIVQRFSILPLLVPDRRDHIEAAALRNNCRRHGVQVGTVDAVLAQLCVRHDLVMLSADKNFLGVSRFTSLRLWMPDT